MSDVEKISCPVRRYQAYIESQINKGKRKRAPPKMISEAKDKLQYEGWTLWSTRKKTKKTKKGVINELRYRSPAEKDYISLNAACKQYIESQNSDPKTPSKTRRDDGDSESSSSSESNSSSKERRAIARSEKGATEDLKSKLKVSDEKSIEHDDEMDCLSSACMADGQFIMCSDCQTSFHTKCVGLEAIPEGKWFCASCSCFLCGEYYECTDQSTITKILCCDQCKSKYHERCLKYIMHQNRCPNGAKVCSLKCYKMVSKRYLESQQSSQRRINNEEIFDYPLMRTKTDRSKCKVDSVCSVCMKGGSLMRCSDCPTQFHPQCVGLEAIPEGKWTCASCYCVNCGSRVYFPSLNKFTNKTVLCCDQCEGKYHLGCLQKIDPDLKKKGTWLCSVECSEIFWHLRGLVGESNSTTVEGLRWTILRWSGENDSGLQKFDNKTRSKHRSKLVFAKELLVDCFDTSVEVHNKTVLISSLLFSREDVLDRLNFWGFYTILLEEEDKIVSAATFRVHGEKIAEMPFIVTHRQYRFKGMCRLLVNVLSKLLSDLGVERLLLLANSKVENMWTAKFNFSKMTSSELLELSQYTFVNFQGTTRLQKVLRKSTISEE